MPVPAVKPYGLDEEEVPGDELRPGEFTSDPELSPEGPVVVIVPIPQQLVHVYRNATRIAVSTTSTGEPGAAIATE